MKMDTNDNFTEPNPQLHLYRHGPSLAQTQYIPLAELSLQAVDNNYPKLLLIISIAVAVLITLVVSVFGIVNPNIPTSAILAILPICLLIAVIIIKLVHLKAQKIAYGVFEHELVFREGLFWVSTTALPYTRLQHVNLSQGPLERRYNLVSLKCFSAGSGVAEIDLPGLNADEAEHLRQHLLTKAGASHAQPSIQHAEPLTRPTPVHHNEDTPNG